MKFRLALLLCVCLLAASLHAQWEYDTHVLFDNGLSDQSYYYGRGVAVPPSKLELVEGKLPLSNANCVSPPNCLKLSWTSSSGGDWNVTLSVVKEWGNADVPRSGDALFFWFYSDAELTPENSP